jgi:hypothetical protein
MSAADKKCGDMASGNFCGVLRIIELSIIQETTEFNINHGKSIRWPLSDKNVVKISRLSSSKHEECRTFISNGR